MWRWNLSHRIKQRYSTSSLSRMRMWMVKVRHIPWNIAISRMECRLELFHWIQYGVPNMRMHLIRPNQTYVGVRRHHQSLYHTVLVQQDCPRGYVYHITMSCQTYCNWNRLRINILNHRIVSSHLYPFIIYMH